MKILFYTIPILILSSCSTYQPVTDFKDVTKYATRAKSKNNLALAKLTNLSLKNAVEIGLKNNPNYLSTKFALIAALERYEQSKSAYYPTLSFSHSMYNTHFNTHYTRNANDLQYEQTGRTTSLNAEWLIYDGLMRKMNTLVAKHKSQSQKLLNQNSKRILTLAITNAYNSILLAKEGIRISNADYDFNNKMLKETQLKYEVGATSLSEVLNFKTKLNNSKNALVTTKHNLNTTKFILAELMGLIDGKIPDNISFPSLKLDKYKALKKIESYLDIALQNRQDLNANRESFKSAKYNIKSKYASFYPKISLNVSGDYIHSNYDDSSSSTTGAISNTIGLNMTWVIFDGFNKLAKLREAKAFANQQEYKLIEKWLSVVAEVRQSYDNYEKNIKQLDILKKNLKLIIQTRDLVEKEYKAGSTSITRLNEVQKDLITAEGNYSSAIINLKNALAQFNAAIGL